jgi:hypothetical protein
VRSQYFGWLLAGALALAPGVALAQGQPAVPPPSAPATSPAPVEPLEPLGPAQGGSEAPVRMAPLPRSVPSSGGSGSVSDFFGSDQAGGTSLTPESGGVDVTGSPNVQSSGQSGSSTYPY